MSANRWVKLGRVETGKVVAGITPDAELHLATLSQDQAYAVDAVLDAMQLSISSALGIGPTPGIGNVEGMTLRDVLVKRDAVAAARKAFMEQYDAARARMIRTDKESDV